MTRKRGLLIAAALVGPALAFGQGYTVTSASAAVTICSPFATKQTEDLGGNLVSGTVDGEVVVDPAATQAARSGTTSAPAASPLKPAAFSVTGRKSATFALAMPDPTECVLTAAGISIPVTGFKVSVAGGAATGTPGGLTLNGRGLQDFKVGASMVVAKGLPRTTYVGRFKVTLTYN